MEIPEFLQHGLQQFRLRQDGSTEMECTRFLAETAARNNTDTRVLQQLERVENIGRLIRLLGSFYRLWWYCNLRESIHGTLNRITTEPLEAIKSVCNHFCSQLQQNSEFLLSLRD